MKIEETITYLAALNDSALLLKSHSAAASLFYTWVKANLSKSSIKKFTQQYVLDLRKPQDRLKLALRIASYFEANPITKEQAPVAKNVSKENNPAPLPTDPTEPSMLLEEALTIAQSNNQELASLVAAKAKTMLESIIKNHFKHQLEQSLTQVFNQALAAHITESKTIATRLLSDSKSSLALLLAG